MPEWTPNKELPWYDQVLDLERRGKPTTLAAHDLATEAKAKHRLNQPVTREPGSDDDR